MIWLSTKETADLLGYSDRAIRNKAKNGEYKCRYISSATGQGGRKMEIPLESLPEQAQIAYQNKHGESQIVVNTNYTSTRKQKEKGELRSEAITGYKEFLKECKKGGMKSKTEIMELFIDVWNRNHEFKLTKSSLYNWMKTSPSGNAEKLTDRRGGYNRGQTTIPEAYRKMFDSLYLQQTQPSVASCFKEVQLAANCNGDYLPGIKAFYNYVGNNISEAVLIKAREGEKAFRDKCLPYAERDYSALHPNEQWVADHHLWDIFVRVPDKKGGWKLERPWGSYWMDMRTRKIMASILRIESPNADVVLCSFSLGVEHFGIPNGVLLDNGKDYKAHDLFYPEGHYILSEKDNKKIERSLASNLDIKVTYAIPYNARAKPIERVFNTFEEQLGKKYPSYAGSNAKKRPEDLKDLDIMDVVTLEEFIAQHNKYVYEIYNNSGHTGNAMYGKSPNQVYADEPFIIRRASKEVLFFALMRVKGTRKIGRNGISFDCTHYWNESCTKYIGKKVTARYSPAKPEILYIFDEDENFLFEAPKVKKRDFDPTEEDYKEENERTKMAKQISLNEFKADNVIRSTKSIGERLSMQAGAIDPAPVAKPNKMELIQNEKMQENCRRINMDDIDREYEDYLAKDRSRKNQISNTQKILGDRFKQKQLNRARNTAKQA